MRLTAVRIKNFRGYRDEVTVTFDDITAFVGKNDIGKSSVLEALDIFFNDGKGTIKLDKDDVNKYAAAAGNTTIEISACFTELPESVVIDATHSTTLQQEYLLNADRQLEIVKKYPNAGVSKVFVRAIHPTNQHCCDLLQKTNRDLRTIIDAGNIECNDRSINAVMRSAIWSHYADNLELEPVEIDITKGDAKSIWGKLNAILPVYSLFQSDRKNSDSDNEIQDPLKEAVKQILSSDDLQQQLAAIAEEVTQKLQEVSTRTLEKLREMAPDVADSLNPVIPAANALKWPDVFKGVSITGDNEIPINKRGSGVRRLVLLNFFRAEAERRMEAVPGRAVIYAIEEPETSQHTNNQKMLIKALIDLAAQPNTQVLITTHSSQVVKALGFNAIRILTSDDGIRCIGETNAQCLPTLSYNEVNYIAFHDVTEEYHNELYGYIEANRQMTAYESGQSTMRYIEERRDGSLHQRQCTLTKYIRHQIHHPENTCNAHFSAEQLEQSIELMRQFILGAH